MGGPKATDGMLATPEVTSDAVPGKLKVMESKLAKLSRQNLVDAMRRLTPEQRLKACVTHSQLLLQLHAAGKRLRELNNVREGR